MLQVVHQVQTPRAETPWYWEVVHSQPKGEKMPPLGLESIARESGPGLYKVLKIDPDAGTMEVIEQFTVGEAPQSPPPPELTFHD